MDSLASPFTESKDLAFTCAVGVVVSFLLSGAEQTQGPSTRQNRSLRGRTCSARDDRVKGRNNGSNRLRLVVVPA